MEPATHSIQPYLDAFELGKLFVAVLGWQPPPAVPLPADLSLPTDGSPHILATSARATLVQLPWQASLTPARRRQLYGALAAVFPEPLLVLGNRDRSLWLWGQPGTPEPVLHSRVWIRSQPLLDWGDWLGRLAAVRLETAGLAAALAPDITTAVQAGIEGLQASLAQLEQQIQGLPGPLERRHYAHQVMARLMALIALQQRRFLDDDEWYLQNRFGQSQQEGRDQFFSYWLRPLWRQGLTLPPWERPRAVERRLGEVPFIPLSLFQRHPLEQRYGAIAIADSGFEAALTWLGDLPLTVTADRLLAVLAPVLEQGAQPPVPPAAPLPPPTVLASLSDRLVQQAVLTRLETWTGQRYPTVADGLMRLRRGIAAPLLADLRQLSVLDPACGAGSCLFTLTGQMTSLLANLTGLAPPPESPETAAGCPNPSLALQGAWMSHNLFGLSPHPEAILLAQLHWFLSLLPRVQQASELASLPDPFLNLQTGNALVGLLQVDAERFDQVSTRASRPAPPAALQGNLLQPLLAADYQAVLRERQIRLEHYRSQTQLLAESGDVPGYAQTEFLRDRLEALNQAAQHKLNQLLLAEWSQQLGIGYRQPDPQKRWRRRPLQLADIEAFQPFHWGFQLEDPIVRRGGFDLVISRLPGGIVQASLEEFSQRQANLLATRGITREALRHYPRPLLDLDGDLARAWEHYRAQLQSLSTYFRRAGAYARATQPPAGQRQLRLYWERLYVERILSLLRPEGQAALVLSPQIWRQANARSLGRWLQETARVGPVGLISNRLGAIAQPPDRQVLALVWLQRRQQPAADGAPPPVWEPTPVPTPETLEAQLQALVDLGEEVG